MEISALAFIVILTSVYVMFQAAKAAWRSYAPLAPERLKPPQKPGRPKRHDLVVYIDCDGCMASDHTVQWIGIIDDLYIQDDFYSNRLKMGHVRIVKDFRRDKPHGDWRDRHFGYEEVVTNTGSFHQMADNLWFIFR